MRIAYLSTFHPYRGGIAQFNARLCREWEKSGHAVFPFTFTRQYPDLLFPGKTQLVTADDHADPIPSQRVLDTIGPWTWPRAAHRINEVKPDVLVMKYWMSFFGPSLGHVAGAVKRNGARVATILDNVLPHERRFFDTPFTTYFLRRSSGFVAMSEKVKADLLSLRPDARVTVLPHPLYDHFGERMDAREARERLGVPAAAKVSLFFGFIRHYKGLDLLLEAIATLPKDHWLVIAGEPYGDMGAIQALIDRPGIRERVVDRIRYIPDHEVPMYFSAADAVVLPYRSATQSGITAIAQHFEVPVIATDVGGLKELVMHERTGLIVPAAEPAAIAASIHSFFESGRAADMRANMAALKKELSWERFAADMLRFVESLPPERTR